MLTNEQAKEIIGDARIISDEDIAELASRLIDTIISCENQAALMRDLTVIKQEAQKLRQSYEFDRGLDIARKYLYDDEDFVKRNIRIETGYTYDEFHSHEPYQRIFTKGSAFERKQEYSILQDMALVVGITKKEFAEFYRSFEQSMRYADDDWNRTSDLPDIKGKPIDLYQGEWTCDIKNGVRRTTDRGEEVACLHPVVPIKRLVNIDTSEEKLEVAFLKGRNWKTFTAPKDELFDQKKVVKYSAIGMSVTSRSAKYLSDYLCEIEGYNYNKIPEIKSVSRLGYIGDDKKDFSPYVKDNEKPIVFDGETNYASIYSAVAVHKGNFEAWRETALRCRSENLTAQILLAASFASPLIDKIGGLVFFVHLWSVTSGTGKTVALMLAASVWGNPDLGGGYIQTFNSTQVGQERTAAFLNNIPMCIDEMQLAKDSHGRNRFDVYQLAQGVGRGRGNKAGGIDRIPRWSLCVLTTGESPMARESDGGGAINRVIDVECGADEIIIKDGMATSRTVKQNYGHAGEMFINSLTDDVIEDARKLYEEYFKQLSSGETTEKQAMAAAMILVGDELADRFIFKSGKHLTVEEISGFLKSKTAVSAGERGYSYICDWVAMNANKFSKESEAGDIYGMIEDGYAYIIYTAFDKAMREAGFDTKAILAWLKSNSLIDVPRAGYTKQKHLRANLKPKCIWLRLPEDNDELSDLSGFEELINK